MKKDAAIDEIRAVRHKISERFGHDTKALLDYYREMEKKYKSRMIGASQPAKKEKGNEKVGNRAD